MKTTTIKRITLPVILGWILVSASCDDRSSGVAAFEPTAPAAVGDGGPRDGGPTDSAAANLRKNPHKKYPANLLAKETSPYLLLHAHNPVRWYPWGEAALAKAKKENKIIFLSVGYSSCYWCHVMERESFTDEEIAAFLNKHFVCIKVDREERPDIDEIYMTALHALGQRGGWPLSMFLTPEAKPFHGGTYHPARDNDRPGQEGFLSVITKVQKLWVEKPRLVNDAGLRLARHVKQLLEQRPVAGLIQLKPGMVGAAQDQLAQAYDAENGGFAYGQTKFPSPSNLLFFLDRARGGNADAKQMLLHTLDKMSQGGIRDHLGGGFHRYSVDPYWHIPHFEKMLYDNGQLATLYAEAYGLTKNPAYRRVLEQLLEFVLRELTDKQGGFYSALDAETDAVEGKYYVWSRKEIKKTLSKDEYALFAALYGIDQAPNFEQYAYAPQLSSSLAQIAKDRGVSQEQLEGQLVPIRARLKTVRDRRKRPLTDTKILAAWNGLMIRGFADAGRVLDQPRYIKAAVRAAEFALKNLMKKGRLMRTSTAGQTKLNGYLEDYALLTEGLIALNRATSDPRWLAAADELMQKQIELFWDEKGGGFYFTSNDHEKLFARRKDAGDGVVPAGSSVSASNLLYLGKALGKPDYRQRATKTLQSLALLLERSPGGAPRSVMVLSALDLPKPKVPSAVDSTPDKQNGGSSPEGKSER